MIVNYWLNTKTKWNKSVAFLSSRVVWTQLRNFFFFGSNPWRESGWSVGEYPVVTMSPLIRWTTNIDSKWRGHLRWRAYTCKKHMASASLCFVANVRSVQMMRTKEKRKKKERDRKRKEGRFLQQEKIGRKKRNEDKNRYVFPFSHFCFLRSTLLRCNNASL